MASWPKVRVVESIVSEAAASMLAKEAAVRLEVVLKFKVVPDSEIRESAMAEAALNLANRPMVPLPVTPPLAETEPHSQTDEVASKVNSWVSLQPFNKDKPSVLTSRPELDEVVEVVPVVGNLMAKVPESVTVPPDKPFPAIIEVTVPVPLELP